MFKKLFFKKKQRVEKIFKILSLKLCLIALHELILRLQNLRGTRNVIFQSG